MAESFDIVIIILGLILNVSGLVGCILPVIPGPPLSYASLLLLSLAKDWEAFSPTFLIVMAVLTALVTILDFVIPVIGAKKYDASRYGVRGSILGMVIGLLFFPPFGIIIGGLVGAIAGELLAGKEGDQALRAGMGVFMGNLAGIGLKLILCGVLLFYYIKEMF